MGNRNEINDVSIIEIVEEAQTRIDAIIDILVENEIVTKEKIQSKLAKKSLR